MARMYKFLFALLLTGCVTIRVNRQPAPERGGFVATLGTDTVHLERFERTGNVIRGTIATRIPTTRVVNWTLTLDATGAAQQYTIETRDADGTLLTNNWTSGSLSFLGDTIVRQTLRDRAPVEHRIAAPRHTVPSPSLPYVGVSYLMYERAFADARRRASTPGDTAIYGLTMLGLQTTAGKTKAWLVGADSAELSYFGVAKSGYKFDANGRLVRSDWTRTTYRYRVTRIADADVALHARRWSELDKAGRGFGALSPRDTTRATVGGAALVVDYSRPSKRGRVVWGEVVPWNQVWRLGADMATHFTTSADLVIGETTIPAGRYTLWLLPTPDAAQLVVSSAVNIFGTGYNPARDFARIPMRRASASETERLTIAVADGELSITWDTSTWSVPVRVK